MSEGLKKLGETFKKKREEMNLTLKEVENATSIRTLYLQSIEEGRAQQFLSAAYALGFIRQYASFLGYDLEKLHKDYPEAFRLAPEKQDFAYGIGTLEMRGNPQHKVRWMPNLAWGAVALLTIIGAWYFGKLIGAF
jgi:cytoskeletal protein RodZ